MPGSVELGRAHVLFTGDFATLMNGIQQVVKTSVSATASITGEATKTERGIAKSNRNIVKSYADVSKQVRATLRGVTTQLVWLQMDIGHIAQMAQRAALAVAAAFGGMAAASMSFEDAFANVRKTVNATEAEFQTLKTSVRKLSTETRTGANDLAKIMGVAGQLGIRGTENLTAFTKTIDQLTIATNLTGEQGASDLARFMNVMQESPRNVDRLGSSIVDLGNNFATTESEILSMGMRVAGAGKTVRLTSQEVLALSTALSAVGIESQMGGTAISRIMINMANSVAKGDRKLREFAKAANTTSKAFTEVFRRSPIEALQMFISGLERLDQQGENVFATLENVGASEIRVRDTLLRLFQASGLLTDAVEHSNKAWEENVALTEEVEKRNATAGSQLRILYNNIVEVARLVGDEYNPIIKEAAGFVKSLTQAFQGMTPEQRAVVAEFGALATAILGGIAGALLATKAFFTLMTAATLLARVVAFLLSPWTLATIAIITAATVIALKWDKIITMLKGSDLGQIATQAWNDFKDVWDNENLSLPDKVIESVKITVVAVLGLVESIVNWFLNTTIDLARKVAVALGVDWENSKVGQVLDEIQKWWNESDLPLGHKLAKLLGISLDPETNPLATVIQDIKAVWDSEDLTLANKVIKTVTITVVAVLGLVESIVNWFLNTTIDLARKVAVDLGVDWENSKLGKLVDQIQEWWNKEDITLAEKALGIVTTSAVVSWSITFAQSFANAVAEQAGLIAAGVKGSKAAELAKAGARWGLALGRVAAYGTLMWLLLPDETKEDIKGLWTSLAARIREYNAATIENPFIDGVANWIETIPTDGWELPALTIGASFAAFKAIQEGGVLAGKLGSAVVLGLGKYALPIAAAAGIAVGLGLITMSDEDREDVKKQIQEIWDNEEMSLTVKVAKTAITITDAVAEDATEDAKTLAQQFGEAFKTAWNEARWFDPISLVFTSATDSIRGIRQALAPTKKFLKAWGEGAFDGASIREAFERGMAGEPGFEQIRGFFSGLSQATVNQVRSFLELGQSISEFMREGFMLGWDIAQIIDSLFLGSIANLAASLTEAGAEWAGSMIAGFKREWEKIADWFRETWLGQTFIKLGIIDDPASSQPGPRGSSVEPTGAGGATSLQDLGKQYVHGPDEGLLRFIDQIGDLNRALETAESIRDATPLEDIRELYDGWIHQMRGMLGQTTDAGQMLRDNPPERFVKDGYQDVWQTIIDVIKQSGIPEDLWRTVAIRMGAAYIQEGGTTAISPFGQFPGGQELWLSGSDPAARAKYLEYFITEGLPQLLSGLDMEVPPESVLREHWEFWSALRLTVKHINDEIEAMAKEWASIEAHAANISFAPGVKRLAAEFELEVPKFHSGTILPGFGGGDRIPALLEAGEAIVPAKVVAGGIGDIVAWFRSMGVVKMQPGGIAGITTLSQAEDEINKVAGEMDGIAQSVLSGISSMVDTMSAFLFGAFDMLATVLQALFPEHAETIAKGLDDLKAWWETSSKAKVTEAIEEAEPGESNVPSAQPETPPFDPAEEMKRIWDDIIGKVQMLGEAAKLIGDEFDPLAETIRLTREVIKALVDEAGEIPEGIHILADALEQLTRQAEMAAMKQKAWEAVLDTFVQRLGDVNGFLGSVRRAISLDGGFKFDSGSLIGDSVSFLVNTLFDAFDTGASELERRLSAPIEPRQDILTITKQVEDFKGLAQAEKDRQNELRNLRDQQQAIKDRAAGGAAAGAAVGAGVAALAALGPIGWLLGGLFGTYAGGSAQKKAAEDEFGPQIKETEKQINRLNDQITNARQTLVEALGIAADNFAQGIADAFQAATITEFAERLGASVKSQLRQAMVQTFIAEDLAEPLEHLKDMAAQMFLESDGPTTAQLALFDAELANVNNIAAILYERFDELGLQVDETTRSLSGMTKNLPSGFRVELARFETTSGIPGLATGGYVPATPGGRIVRLAEGGEGEYVVPESRMGGGGTEIHNHFHGPVYGMDDFNRRVEQATDKAARKRGLVTTGNPTGGWRRG